MTFLFCKLLGFNDIYPLYWPTSKKDLIRVNEVKKEEHNVRVFATVVFGDSFKITNIALL